MFSYVTETDVIMSHDQSFNPNKGYAVLNQVND